jgi:hypothetical protein
VEFSSHEQAIAWFKAEHHVLASAIRLAAKYGCHRHAWQLAVTLQEFYRRQGYWQDWAATMRAGLCSATDAQDATGHAAIQRSLAETRSLLDRDTEPEYQRVAVDPDADGGFREQLAQVRSLLDQDEEALARYIRAVAVLAATDDPAREVALLGTGGWSALTAGN